MLVGTVGKSLRENAKVTRDTLLSFVGAFTGVDSDHELEIVARLDPLDQRLEPFDLVSKRLRCRILLEPERIKILVVRTKFIEAAGKRHKKPPVGIELKRGMHVVDRASAKRRVYKC